MQVLWEKRAIRQMRKIPMEDRSTILAEVGSLSGWPRTRNVKALKNQPYPYRLRVGQYRVFFSVESDLSILKIEEVKRRNERTYRASGH
jgi:mRNA interferase RelE/StbE